MQILAFNPLTHIQSVPVFQVGRFAITNSMITITVAVLLLGVGIPWSVRKRALVPGGWQNLIETICDFIRKEVAQPVLKERTDSFIGFIWTVFFFILTLNLLGMIPVDPLLTIVTGTPRHWFGAATANIYVTTGMAIITFIVTHFFGIRVQGVKHYFMHFAPRGPLWVMPLLYVIEILSTFIKPLSLTLRLFANMVAGHMVQATFIGLIIIFHSFLVATASVSSVVLMSLLDLLIAFIQAFIFTFLSALYIGFALTPEH